MGVIASPLGRGESQPLAPYRAQEVVDEAVGVRRVGVAILLVAEHEVGGATRPQAVGFVEVAGEQGERPPDDVAVSLGVPVK